MNSAETMETRENVETAARQRGGVHRARRLEREERLRAREAQQLSEVTRCSACGGMIEFGVNCTRWRERFYGAVCERCWRRVRRELVAAGASVDAPAIRACLATVAVRGLHQGSGMSGEFLVTSA